MYRRLVGNISLLLACVLVVGCQTDSGGVGTQRPGGSSPGMETPDPTNPSADPRVFTGNNEPIDPDPVVPGSRVPLNLVFYFEFDQAVISRDDLETLDKHARVLRENPASRVLVEGHCDERGTREYNLALGERRADAIRGYLVAAGVPESRVETISYGEERPADPGHTEAAWSRNRRAELAYR